MSIEQFVKEQLAKWSRSHRSLVHVITISSEPGSGGRVIAKQISEELGVDLFDRDIIKGIAESAKISDTVIETMEKDRLSGAKDFISSLVNDRYLSPGVYLDHLMKVVSVIAGHGDAVIVGRGANFIIPPKDRLSVRIIAPLNKRADNVAKTFGVTREEAKRRVINRENRRSGFIRESFNADVADPQNYDLLINTDKMSIDASVDAIVGAVVGGKDIARQSAT